MQHAQDTSEIDTKLQMKNLTIGQDRQNGRTVLKWILRKQNMTLQTGL
jgi:hypothetical protein